jgi:hypothetical protein
LFEFGSAIAKRPWYIYHYDRRVMDTIKKLTPSARFKRFDEYLKRYIKREVPEQSLSALEEDDRFFRRFYFDHNDDPKLLERWQNALTEARAR